MAIAHDIGSLGWGRSGRGVLSRSERRNLRVAVLRDAYGYARSRWLLAVGRGSRHGYVDLEVMDMPDTALCQSVEAVARARQSPQMLGHAYRTVAFAHAVAGIDGVSFDAELLWSASLLHDVELENPIEGHCFAVRGGELAERVAIEAGVDPSTAHLLGDAVSRHATPNLDPSTHPLPYLIASGALVDVLGKRLEQMDPRLVSAVNEARPRDCFPSVLASAWRAEARAVPGGRAALAERTTRFSLAARFAPL